MIILVIHFFRWQTKRCCMVSTLLGLLVLFSKLYNHPHLYKYNIVRIYKVNDDKLLSHFYAEKRFKMTPQSRIKIAIIGAGPVNKIKLNSIKFILKCISS